MMKTKAAAVKTFVPPKKLGLTMQLFSLSCNIAAHVLH